MGEPTFVAALDDVPEGDNRAFDVNGVSILLCRTRNGLYAVANRCSHAGSELVSGIMKGSYLFCPSHGARFDLRDGSTKGQLTKEPIRTYPVHLDGERILVDLGQ